METYGVSKRSSITSASKPDYAPASYIPKVPNSQAFNRSFNQTVNQTGRNSSRFFMTGGRAETSTPSISNQRWQQRANQNSVVSQVKQGVHNHVTGQKTSWVSRVKEDDFGPFANEKASHLAPSFLRDLEDIWEDGAPMAVRLHQEMHLAVETGIENLGFGNLDKDARDIASIHGFNAKSYITGIFSGHSTNAITTPSGRFGRDTSQLLVGMFGIVGGGEKIDLGDRIDQIFDRLESSQNNSYIEIPLSTVGFMGLGGQADTPPFDIKYVPSGKYNVVVNAYRCPLKQSCQGIESNSFVIDIP